MIILSTFTYPSYLIHKKMNLCKAIPHTDIKGVFKFDKRY